MIPDPTITMRLHATDLTRAEGFDYGEITDDAWDLALTAPRSYVNSQSVQRPSPLTLWRPVLIQIIHDALLPLLPVPYTLRSYGSRHENPVRLATLNGRPVQNDRQEAAARRQLRNIHVDIPLDGMMLLLQHHDALTDAHINSHIAVWALLAGLDIPEMTDPALTIDGLQLLLAFQHGTTTPVLAQDQP